MKTTTILLALALATATACAQDATWLPANSKGALSLDYKALRAIPMVAKLIDKNNQSAVSAGILKGYPDGTLRPGEPITRAEALVLLSRCLPELEAKREPIAFTDVPAWAKKDVDRLSAAGLVEGYGNGRLGTGDLLTVAQAVLLAQRAADIGTEGAVLSLWTSDAPARTALMDYMAAITDEESPDYIPVSDRIAVFDMDGTVFCETDPVYFDHMLFLYRVTQDPDYKDRASEFEKEVAEKIRKEFIEKGTYPAGMDVAHGQGVASAFAGMTLSEFDAYVQAFQLRELFDKL